RESWRFERGPAAAGGAGSRPGKRCRPTEAWWARRRAAIAAPACRRIEQAEELPSLAELAKESRLSPFHFHRLFKAVTGVTPKDYAVAHRAKRVRDEITRSGTITEAIYRAGFNSNGRFYD